MQTVKHIDLDMIELVKEGARHGTSRLLIMADELNQGKEQEASNEATGMITRMTFDRSTAMYRCYLNGELKSESVVLETPKGRFTYYIGKHEMDIHPKKYSIVNKIKTLFDDTRVKNLKHELKTM